MSNALNKTMRRLLVPGAGHIMPGAGNALAARGALHDPVGVDRKAGRPVLGSERHHHQVVLRHLDPVGAEGVVLRHDGELAAVGCPVLRVHRDDTDRRRDDYQSVNTAGLYPAGEGAGYEAVASALIQSRATRYASCTSSTPSATAAACSALPASSSR